MINLKSAELIVSLITFLLSYLFATTIAGAFRAWVADKMGDSTAQDCGFLTLNPLVHMDPIGMMFVCLFSFGWSKFIPINPQNIDGSIRFLGIKSGWRLPKLLCAYLSDSFVYFSIAFICLVTIILIFGPMILYIAPSMLLQSSCMSHLFLAHAFPGYSSFTIVIGFILIVATYLSIVIGVLDGTINCCHLALALYAERSPDQILQYGYLIVLIPSIIIILFAGHLRILITSCIIYFGWLVTHLLGLF